MRKETKIFTMLVVFSLFIVSVASAFNMRNAQVRKYATIGYKMVSRAIPGALLYIQNGIAKETTVATDLVRLKAMSGQTGDFIDARNSSDVTVFKVDSTGAITATGSATFDGGSFGAPVTLNWVTADPCGSYPIGSIFYNRTSGYQCFCDNNGDDIKTNDNTTACF